MHIDKKVFMPCNLFELNFTLYFKVTKYQKKMEFFYINLLYM